MSRSRLSSPRCSVLHHHNYNTPNLHPPFVISTEHFLVFLLENAPGCLFGHVTDLHGFGSIRVPGMATGLLGRMAESRDSQVNRISFSFHVRLGGNVRAGRAQIRKKKKICSAGFSMIVFEITLF